MGRHIDGGGDRVRQRRQVFGPVQGAQQDRRSGRLHRGEILAQQLHDVGAVAGGSFVTPRVKQRKNFITARFVAEDFKSPDREPSKSHTGALGYRTEGVITAAAHLGRDYHLKTPQIGTDRAQTHDDFAAETDKQSGNEWVEISL